MVGPLLEPLVGDGLVVRMTIGVRTPYQIDVVKLALVDEAARRSTASPLRRSRATPSPRPAG
jgi:hypothetical protein